MEVLSNSRLSSLQLAYVVVTIIYMRRSRRRDKVLVLEMEIYHLSYLIVLLTCQIGCDHSALRISKKLG